MIALVAFAYVAALLLAPSVAIPLLPVVVVVMAVIAQRTHPV